MDLILGILVIVPLFFVCKYLISRENSKFSLSNLVISSVFSIFIELCVAISYILFCFYFVLIIPIPFFSGIIIGFLANQVFKITMLFLKIDQNG